MDSVSDIDKLNTPTTDLLLTASYETHKAVRDKWKLWINEGMPEEYNTNLFVTIKLQRDWLRTHKTPLIIITKAKYIGKQMNLLNVIFISFGSFGKVIPKRSIQFRRNYGLTTSRTVIRQK